MKNFYCEYSKFHVAIDCIIFGFTGGKLSLLVQKRSFEPAKGQWSLMGGFVRKDESIDEAAHRILFELTGLADLYMEQVGTFGEIGRDPGERVISVAYYALIAPEKYDTGNVRNHNACWMDMDNVPKLIFDHDDMVAAAKRRMREKASVSPIGFNLLPEKFTLSQLQSLYEAISGSAMDKRNFRKKVASMKFIGTTGEKDKTGSRKGAVLYRFIKEEYDKEPEFKIL